MKNLKMFVERLSDVELPKKTLSGSNAEIDFFVPRNLVIQHATASNKVGLGISIEIPEGFVLLLTMNPTVGRDCPLRMSNGIESISKGSKKEICIFLDNISQFKDVELQKGQQIVRGVLVPIPEWSIEEK